jgi:hypothetical protein
MKNYFFNLNSKKKLNKPNPKLKIQPVKKKKKNKKIRINSVAIGKKIIPTNTITLGSKEIIHHINSENCYNYSIFYPSNATIIKYNDEYIINIRYVNYLIYNISKQDTNYVGKYNNNEGVFISINKYVKLNSSFQEIESKWLDVDFKKADDMVSYRTNKQIESTREIVLGIEDIRLYNFNSSIKYMGALRVDPYTTSIVMGDYNYCNLDNNNIINNNSLTYENNCKHHLTSCEKNWSLVDLNNQLYVVYKWYPIQICSIYDNSINLTKQIDSPIFFKNMRGSSCASKFNNNIWFLTHIVDADLLKNGSGKYFHVFVIFDSELNLIKYSQPFTFDNKLIEFCIGLVVEEENILMTYSIYDNSSVLGIYNKVKLINSLAWICL